MEWPECCAVFAISRKHNDTFHGRRLCLHKPWRETDAEAAVHLCGCERLVERRAFMSTWNKPHTNEQTTCARARLLSNSWTYEVRVACLAADRFSPSPPNHNDKRVSAAETITSARSTCSKPPSPSLKDISAAP